MTEAEAQQLGRTGRHAPHQHKGCRSAAGSSLRHRQALAAAAGARPATPIPTRRAARAGRALDIDPARIDLVSQNHLADSMPTMRTYFRSKEKLSAEPLDEVEAGRGEIRAKYAAQADDRARAESVRHDGPSRPATHRSSNRRWTISWACCSGSTRHRAAERDAGRRFAGAPARPRAARALGWREAEQMAERQANRLRSQLGVARPGAHGRAPRGPAMADHHPARDLSDVGPGHQDRLRLGHHAQAGEPMVRQRFSLAMN